MQCLSKKLDEAAAYISVAANGYKVDENGHQHYVNVNQARYHANMALKIICDLITQLEVEDANILR